MKDLEKIKSEDLAAQVQDANPANFAIEQEVAQLVGATVPAPTEPSDDDARELPAQLLVFLRRALTPIRSALRTALAAIYAQLDSRCTDYTPAAYAPYIPRPYDPMGTLPARTLPNLLTALTAFSARKISDLGDVPDGMTVLQLYTGRNSGITKIKDTYAWDLCYRDQLYQLFNALPSLEDIYIRCKRLTGYSYGYNVWFPSTITKCNGSTDTFEMPDLERFEGSAYVGFPTLAQNFKKWSFPKMVYTRCGFSYKYNQLDPRVIDWVEEVYMPKCKTFGEYASENILANFTNLKTVIMGNVTIHYSYNAFVNDENLIHLEVGADGELLDHSASYAGWSPTNALDASRTDLIEQGSTAENNLQQFLQNFKEHIALRLTSNGGGKTLTLSQAVRDAIHAAEATYGIEAIIVTQKGWTLSPAPTA